MNIDKNLWSLLAARLRTRGGALVAAVAVMVLAGSVAMTRTGPAESAVAAPDPASGSAAAPSGEAQDPGGAQAVPGDAAAVDDRPAAVEGDPFALPAITGGVPRQPRPDVVRGLYLNAWAAGSTAKLERLIGIANRTEVNAFVIDVKEGGEISYRSSVPLARAIGADRAYIGNVRGMLAKLRENGIYPIARIVVFRDEKLADARPAWSVRHVNGGEWKDGSGHAWVDSYNRDVWDYNIAIAREALELGFSEVQWDYVRFPDVPQALMRTAAWPAQAGRTKQDAIREFLLYSREQLKQYDAPVTADVFGLTVSVRNDMGIGQLWEKMVDATDVLLPMVYPSHFARGSYGIAHPNASPYETVKTAMEHAVRRTSGVANAAKIRPWLQDFTLGQPRYGPAHVRAQIQGAYDAGVMEWVLWHPGSNYTEAALASADGTAPVFPSSALTGSKPPAAAPRAPRGPVPLGAPVGRDTAGGMRD
jgi:hypothetical protein